MSKPLHQLLDLFDYRTLGVQTWTRVIEGGQYCCKVNEETLKCQEIFRELRRVQMYVCTLVGRRLQIRPQVITAYGRRRSLFY